MWSRLAKSRSSAPAAALVLNRTRNSVVAQSANIADSAATRRKGLLGRTELNRGEGLWIIPCSAVHSWGMQFSIDLVYLDRKRRVRKVRPALSPWKFSACLLAHSVLELPVGTIAETQTKAGDQIDIQFVPAGG
jgi:uncharacterized membrane protein (UPF0127 family)